MTTLICTPRPAAWLMALLVCIPWATASWGDATATSAAVDSDMIRQLQAAGPHASLGSGAEALGRLVGTWEVEYSFFPKDGKVKHKSGAYSAGWIMDGRALQDIWTVDASGDRKQREIYTTLHYVDPKSGTWYATFVDPEHTSVARFTGSVVDGDRIVILTQDLSDGKEDRWSYNGIQADSFVFRDEQSGDGGKTWRLLEEDRFTRRGVAQQGSM